MRTSVVVLILGVLLIGCVGCVAFGYVALNVVGAVVVGGPEIVRDWNSIQSPAVVQPAPAAVQPDPAADQAAAPITGNCAGEATQLSPQGEWVNGRFSAKDIVAPAGYTNVLFDGQLVKDGPQVFLVFDGRVAELTHVQGTWYATCGDVVAIATRIAHEKVTRNPDLHTQVWDKRDGASKLLLELNK